MINFIPIFLLTSTMCVKQLIHQEIKSTSFQLKTVKISKKIFWCEVEAFFILGINGGQLFLLIIILELIERIGWVKIFFHHKKLFPCIKCRKNLMESAYPRAGRKFSDSTSEFVGVCRDYLIRINFHAYSI